MKYIMMILFTVVTISCNSPSKEIMNIEKSLSEEFKNYQVVPKKIALNDDGSILNIYFDDNSENVQNFLLLREAAIKIIDQGLCSNELEIMVFKFPTSSAKYFDFLFQTKYLYQKHTKNLVFANPIHSFEKDNFQETIDFIAESAGKGTADGGSVYYYPEAGFSINKGHTITYYARGSKGCNQYMQELPYGIKFDMSKQQLLELLGEPENESRVNWEFKGKEISILFKDNKIYWVEQLEKDFSKSLREKYPIKKK